MPELENRFLKPTEHLRSLQLLEEISKDSTISQRKLSQRLGSALGVTNACLKKMINKGLVKAKGINHKRIAYYLTPKGFNEKTKLTYHFLEYTIRYYIDLKNNIAERLDMLSKEDVKRVVYYGAGEVMEVAYIVLRQTPLELIGIVDDAPDKKGKKMFGFAIQDPKYLRILKPDAIVVTSQRFRNEILNKLSQDATLKQIKLCIL